MHVPAHREGPVEQGDIAVGVVLEERCLHAFEGPFEGQAGLIAASRAFPLAEDGFRGFPRHGHV